MALNEISATDAATALLAKLYARHGPLRLQISGSYGVSVICLTADELRLGARDELVGHIGETPVYMMINEARYWRDARVIIDVAKGVGVGFSIEGPERVHFTLRRRMDPSLRDWTGQGRQSSSAEG